MTLHVPLLVQNPNLKKLKSQKMEPQFNKSKTTISQIPTLPQDLVISEILIRLPVKSLVRFKSVCKDWRDIICNPKFAKSHFDRTKLEPSNSGLDRALFIRSTGSCDMLKSHIVENNEKWESIKFKDCNHLHNLGNGTSIRVIGSCNGLVCFYFRQSNSFCLWNPCIDEFCLIPFPKTFYLNSGFGYVSNEDDYKIFAIGFPCESRERSGLVYSLRGKKWKKISGLVDGLAGLCMDGVLIGETLYWAPNKIFGFNLGDEKFHEVGRNQLGDNFLCMGLCAIDGTLCGWDYERDFSTDSDVIELCMFKYQEDLKSWTKMFKFDVSTLGLYVRTFFGFTKSNKVFVQRNHELEMELFIGCPGENQPGFESVVQGAGHVVGFSETIISPSHLLNG